MAKQAKLKLPKRIGGVKIPKRVRKGPLGQFLNSSAGQLVLAESVMLAAGVFGVKQMDSNSKDNVREFARHPLESLKSAILRGDARAALTDSSERLGFAFTEAARAFRAALEERRDVPESKSDWSADLTVDTDAKKKSPGSIAETSSTPH